MSTRDDVHAMLVNLGFTDNYINRAFKVYEKNYGMSYDVDMLTELIVRLQNKDKNKKNASSPRAAAFPSHLSLDEAYQLQIGDKVDHRDELGRFVYAEVAQKQGTVLKIHYVGWSEKWDKWSDFKQELHRFAKAGAISQRPASSLLHLKIEDVVEMNPTHKHAGWRTGTVRKIDQKSGQIQVMYEFNGQQHLYWLHRDNAAEIKQNSGSGAKSFAQPQQPQKQQSKGDIRQELTMMGFDLSYIDRAIKLCERNYILGYDTQFITELIVRLQEKDAKKGKKRQSSKNTEAKDEDDKDRNQLTGKSQNANVQLANQGLTEHELFAKYKIQSQSIGAGAFSQVKIIKDQTSGKQYALKLVKKENKSTEFIDVLKREILYLSKLTNHPNIVKIYDYCDCEKAVYMVLEYCNGGDVMQKLGQCKQFSEQEAKHVGKQIIAGICYFHQFNIVHRDLKLDNLMYSNGVIKIIDFGLASECTYKPCTTPCGTIHFAAPEVVASNNYTTQADIWSFGVIIYMLICGFPPFLDLTGNQMQLMEIIKRGKFQFMPLYFDPCHVSLKDLITKCLTTDPTKRINAEQARDHEWFTGNNTASSSNAGSAHKAKQASLNNGMMMNAGGMQPFGSPQFGGMNKGGGMPMNNGGAMPMNNVNVNGMPMNNMNNMNMMMMNMMMMNMGGMSNPNMNMNNANMPNMNNMNQQQQFPRANTMPMNMQQQNNNMNMQGGYGAYPMQYNQQQQKQPHQHMQHQYNNNMKKK